VLVNGREREVRAPLDESLLAVLRGQLRLTGSKQGCGVGECGACTVLIGGQPRLACITLAGRVEGEVETVEGLLEESADLRAEFADAGAFQCGYCTPGYITTAVALLRSGLPADDSELRRLLSGNICRCTGYAGIVQAIRRVEVERARTSIQDSVQK
jgi:aerobic-type carbon monoxide dehydrogenase small subunit (CoxS/CutS family)